jgi:DNA-binding FrmR family transcriptional regulator
MRITFIKIILTYYTPLWYNLSVIIKEGKIMKEYPSHIENVVALKRIEGQVRGIQKMVQERKYCVDILNQIHAIIAALARVEDKILEKHFENCVTNAIQGKSVVEKANKLSEVMQLIKRFRKT